MNIKNSHEFFYFNPQKDSPHIDFTGSDEFTAPERFEYLKHYADFLEKFYSVPNTPEKVVNDKECLYKKEELSLDLTLPGHSHLIPFNTMNAQIAQRKGPYIGWALYTKKVRVEDNSLVFIDNDLAPSAGAVFEFKNGDKLREFEFDFYMDEKYKAEFACGIIENTYGRVVELRNGVEDIVKLQFYPDGSLHARLGHKCEYRLIKKPLGNFEFNKTNNVKIVMLSDGFKVVLNGEESELLPFSKPLSPDTLFVGCGMFNYGKWSFTPKAMVFDDNTVKSFFPVCVDGYKVVEDVGEVELPYRVGLYEHRNCAIIFTKEIEISYLKKAELTLLSLDPGGEVFVNDIKVAETDGFETLRVDISDYLKFGKNIIKVIVFPRAPEVFCTWHRQKDPYNGWFCENVLLYIYDDVKIENFRATTLKAGSSCDVEISADFSRDVKTKLYIKKIFPETEDEILLGSFATVDRNLCRKIKVKADLWSPETPNIYALRLCACDNKGNAISDTVIETGFRTIEQKNGQILLNGSPIVLKGALTMQFLPPHKETSATHICPRTEQIIWQLMMLKRLGGNTLRLHILGYGTNDERYTRIADRLGVMLIWITRYIDSAEQIPPRGAWYGKDAYLRQMKERINAPSIIMWEGSNEYHPSLEETDLIFKEFVPAVKSVDTSRLICPVSHLYYAGDCYPVKGCGYYSDDGTQDHDGNSVQAPEEWCDPLVVRSAHTYDFLLGYGQPWRKLREQDWSRQRELFESKAHSYIVSEFAITARQNPDSPDAKEFFNTYSYEFPDEDPLGFRFSQEQWRESQAYQALAAKYAIQVLRQNDADGMLWCCLLSGANDGGYLKPPIDCYGYPKFAFYTMREQFSDTVACTEDLDLIKPYDFELNPLVLGTQKGKHYHLNVKLYTEEGYLVSEDDYDFTAKSDKTRLDPIKPDLKFAGYYYLSFTLNEQTKKSLFKK